MYSRWGRVKADDIASRMSGFAGDLSRRALEALALEEFKGGRITKPELRHRLALATGTNSTDSLARMTCMKTTQSKTLSKNSKA